MTPKIVASNDTIVAPASGAGRAAIAVIRMSGPTPRHVLEALCGGVPPPRHAALRDIGPPHGPLIDRGLVLWFPAPASFTGEDMAELHVHGSRAVIRAVIDAVLSFGGTKNGLLGAEDGGGALPEHVEGAGRLHCECV